ncbi:PREDICTED: centrosomal protein of 85 kDa, partial [Nanorana parkeri]|uniref:centrosomal protein of 85 kDa n=1 Tax=Nanorana parkeri TaxID=125878 RepID=UPI000854B92D
KEIPSNKNVEDFCNASGSTSFQPIKSQVTIPTALVVPSTLAVSSSNTHVQDRAPLSTEAALSIFSTQPTLDPSTADDTRKFEMPNIEPTLNQSGLLNTFCSDMKHEIPAVAASSVVAHFKALPESKETGVAELTRRTVFSGATHQGWGIDSFKQCSAGEYSAWRRQQNQYTENLRMNMEKLQLMRDYPTMLIHPAAIHQSSNDWERAAKASDGNLLEKQLMLERQWQHISQLEQRLRESEMKAHNTLLSQTSPYNDMCLIRLQDLQREVTFLRAQFAEKTESSGHEKGELEKKLCAMEAENRDLREAIKEAALKHSDELKRQEERVKGREKHINSLKKKCQKEAEQNKEKQQKIESLERYMADLPTAQDHQKQLRQLNELQEKNCLLQEQVSDLENKLAEARATCRENETKLTAENFKAQEYWNTIESLQMELKKLETTEWKVEEKRLLQEAEDLQQEVESLQKDKEGLRKVVESQNFFGTSVPSCFTVADISGLVPEALVLRDRGISESVIPMMLKARKTFWLRQIIVKLKVLRGPTPTRSELQEHVGHEEGMGQALREESQRKDAALQQLKVAVKELAIQNQDLIERNVTLQEQLKLACVKGEPTQMEIAQLLKLYKEMNRCQKDLRSVCTLLSQRMQGSDPNLSMLLGVNSTSIVEDQEEPSDLVSLERYVNGIKQLKKDIEDLRTTISDRYAQDMGDNCITQ